ncbi:MAG: acetate--CoA ligase [Verrucomicrobia bacterium]|nr:MAG: acetate--CoA ligase [Verrucomicrobiota bacterium]TAE86424.1 MAG: acetate--CoA ligase [Verrucomicrobiota bacterium]TAF23977.1 MAG: acetate--CoA ligase [Verrucomicrobiota bacterium]
MVGGRSDAAAMIPFIDSTAAQWVRPNLPDYAAACRSFSWESVLAELDGLPGGGLNIAHEAVDRHARGRFRDRVAIRCLGAMGDRRELSFAELAVESNRFANVLRALGVGRGERVFSLSRRVPELYIAALGTLKNTSVFCPLFPAFGPGPIVERLVRGNGRVLVTSSALYREKVAGVIDQLPELRALLLTDAPDHWDGKVLSLPRLMAEASGVFRIPPTDPEDMALLHFTSGTTGPPKAAVHVHQAVLLHYATGRDVLDLHSNDVFWCTADPGWVTGTSYGIIAPLLHGVTMVVDEADFDAERWYRVLAEQRVSVWYTAPTAIRRLMRLGGDPRERHDLDALRLILSVGEPLNPEAVRWGERTFGVPIRDNWWQTETGGIMIANFPACEIRPGSMGLPLPGIEAAIVRVGENGVEEIEEPGIEGELALRANWPSMFRAYLHDDERYRKCFSRGWYLSGDRAKRDAEGYYWFVGRGDDIIKTAGHMVGPFEVESVLMEHPAVAEAGVIGKPDPLIGQVVKAFVSLKEGCLPTEELRRSILGFARKRLGSAVAPKEIAFSEGLPRTRSGKIMRRLLRARELGLAEGDLSTLED